MLAGKGVNRVLSAWLELVYAPERVHVFDPAVEIADRIGPAPIDTVCAARNDIVRRFLTDTGRPWLVMFDDDVYPVAATLEMVTSDLPFCGCRIWGKAGKESHAARSLVCLSAVKIAREVLEAIDPPCFEYESSDGDIMVCECIAFSDKVAALGHAPTKVGTIGHCTPFVATVIEDGKLHVIQECQFPLPTRQTIDQHLARHARPNQGSG